MNGDRSSPYFAPLTAGIGGCESEFRGSGQPWAMLSISTSTNAGCRGLISRNLGMSGFAVSRCIILTTGSRMASHANRSPSQAILLRQSQGPGAWSPMTEFHTQKYKRPILLLEEARACELSFVGDARAERLPFPAGRPLRSCRDRRIRKARQFWPAAG